MNDIIRPTWAPEGGRGDVAHRPIRVYNGSTLTVVCVLCVRARDRHSRLI